MPNSKKRCGQWGPFFVGDPVIYRSIRWRVVAAQKKDVPFGRVPIRPEDEEAESIVGTEMVPIDDLDRV
jgi:hypothetical protein